jgi:hypothetical protein
MRQGAQHLGLTGEYDQRNAIAAALAQGIN